MKACSVLLLVLLCVWEVDTAGVHFQVSLDRHGDHATELELSIGHRDDHGTANKDDTEHHHHHEQHQGCGKSDTATPAPPPPGPTTPKPPTKVGMASSEHIHIGHKLLDEEVKFVTKRRLTVQECLVKHNGTVSKKLNIALIGSGGGARAMVALLGSMRQLKKEGLLDCIMYLSGVSGSTWGMASLYKEEDWSNNLGNVTDSIVQRLSGDGVSWEARGEKLKKYYDETDNYSLTHFWSAIVVPIWVKEIDETRLSAQKGKHGMDPYPIFTVIDKGLKQQKPQTKTVLKDTWVEMTIPTAGYSLAGAFVDQTYFGSKFDNGCLVKDQEEMDMLYIQAEESSYQAYEVLQYVVEINLRASGDEDYSDLVPKLNKLLEGKTDKQALPVVLDTMHMEKAVAVYELKRFTLLVCERFSVWYKDQEGGSFGDIFLRTMECIVQWKWGTTYDFLYKMQVESVDPDLLATTTRDYMDAGLKLNSPYFSVLRPERNIDLIISLDFSAGDPMLTVSEAHTLAMKLGIAFPPVKFPKDAPKTPTDFYEFQPKNQEDTNVPTVIHMPLFNTVNCGDDLKKMREKYKTLQGAYSPEMIKELMELAAENVRNTADKLWDAIRARARK